jgi:hypothetical protein
MSAVNKDGGKKKPKPKLGRRGPCWLWKNGSCKYGTACRYEHAAVGKMAAVEGEPSGGGREEEGSHH